MHIVIVPGTGWGSEAGRVGDQVARAWGERAPADTCDVVWLSDGGPGFAAALAADAAHRPDDVVVLDAAALAHHAGGASTRGPDLLRGTSVPLGLALAGARDTGAARVVVGLGGARDAVGWADGGVGLLAGLTSPTPALIGGVGALRALHEADLPDLRELRADLGRQRWLVAAASTDPLLGPHGLASGLVAAGALTPAQAQEVEGSLGDLVQLLAARLGDGLAGLDLLGRTAPNASARARDLGARPAGACGGGAGLMLSILGTQTVSGLTLTADHARLDQRLATADLVLCVPPVLDAHEVDHGVTPFVGARALDQALPAIVLTGASHAGRREWSALGVSAMYETAARPTMPGERPPAPAEAVAALATSAARTWSR
ncbi:MAG: glycerate kinase [Cellulomonadaceae bacterium]